VRKQYQGSNPGLKYSEKRKIITKGFTVFSLFLLTFLSAWPRGLNLESAAARLLGLRV
jgi:hypothetical protein